MACTSCWLQSKSFTALQRLLSVVPLQHVLFKVEQLSCRYQTTPQMHMCAAGMLPTLLFNVSLHLMKENQMVHRTPCQFFVSVYAGTFCLFVSVNNECAQYVNMYSLCIRTSFIAMQVFIYKGFKSWYDIMSTHNDAMLCDTTKSATMQFWLDSIQGSAIDVRQYHDDRCIVTPLTHN